MKAAVFDLDGTLVDSLEDIMDACNHALNELGHRSFTLDEYKVIAGVGNKRILQRCLRICLEDEPHPDLVEKAVSLKVAYDNGPNGHCHTKAYPGIHEMLNTLQDKGIQLAILSNKTEHHVRSIVSKTFPTINFCHVAGARDDTPLKPNPTSVLSILENHFEDVDSSECAFVGDTEIDMMTSKAAGMTPVGVPWGIRPTSLLHEHGAALVVSEAEEISNFVLTAVSA